MGREEMILEAVSAGYRAAFRPAHWPEAIGLVARAVGGAGGALGCLGADGRSSGAVCPDTDPELHSRYAEDLHAHNYIWAEAARRPPGAVLTEAMLGDRAGYHRSVIYNEFIRPQRMDSVLTMTLASGGGGVALMSFGRPRGRGGFAAADLLTARRLARALGEALALAASLPAIPLGPDPADLAARYDLTPREAAVAALIGAGLTLPQAAARLGIALSTARTHLTRIFDKTGTRHQTALALLAAGAGAGRGRPLR